MKVRFLLTAGIAALGACSAPPEATSNGAAPVANAAAAATLPAPTPSAAPEAAKPATAGFDSANAPVVDPKLGAWPYFGLMDGYVKGFAGEQRRLRKQEILRRCGVRPLRFLRRVQDDFPVEGRLFTTRAFGKGASFFQVQKTYEKLVHDLGGRDGL